MKILRKAWKSLKKSVEDFEQNLLRFRVKFLGKYFEEIVLKLTE